MIRVLLTLARLPECQRPLEPCEVVREPGLETEALLLSHRRRDQNMIAVHFKHVVFPADLQSRIPDPGGV